MSDKQIKELINKAINATVHGMGNWLQHSGVVIRDKESGEIIPNAEIAMGQSYTHMSVFIAERLLEECEITYNYPTPQTNK